MPGRSCARSPPPLARLLDTGQPTTIDHGALPFSAGDEKALEALLGVGEVHATIDALGTSHLNETGTPGVWRVDHFDQQGETLSRFAEITFVPDILKSQAPDVAAGLKRLEAQLAARDGSWPHGGPKWLTNPCYRS